MIRTGSVSTTWAPRPTVEVKAALAHQARSGADILGSAAFASNSLSLSASAQF
jgi:hypothetical protein